MRNKLGIIQLELPDIQLASGFGEKGDTEITDFLFEEQKEIIKTLGGTKLVLLHCNSIVDSNAGEITNIHIICNKVFNYLDTFIVDGSDNQIELRLYESGGKYYIYS